MSEDTFGLMFAGVIVMTYGVGFYMGSAWARFHEKDKRLSDRIVPDSPEKQRILMEAIRNARRRGL